MYVVDKASSNKPNFQIRCRYHTGKFLLYVGLLFTKLELREVIYTEIGTQFPKADFVLCLFAE
jgi:hypothetical protein